MAEDFSFRCVAYEHSLKMFCIQSNIYGRGEGFVLYTKRMHSFLKIFELKYDLWQRSLVLDV